MFNGRKTIDMFGLIRKMFGGNRPDYKSLVQAGAIMIDVRSPGEFTSGHAKGCVNIPLDNIQSVTKKYKKSDVLILCCRSGMRSGSATKQLKSLGFQSVYNAGPWQNLNGVK
jgi:rhodanese-related sulfurtransferase